MVQRRRLLQGAAASALPAAHAVTSVQAQAPAQPAPKKVLRTVFPTSESALDPAQTNSSYYSATILAHIHEAPLRFDYLARPVRLEPNTAAAMPEVSADGKSFTLRLRPGIFFADDPAFKGQPRELTAQDYVYAIKRFYDPKLNSSDLYLYESLKLPGLSELRDKAVKNKAAFEYDTPVEGVRALDRHTLRIVLGESNPRFIYQLADHTTCGAVAREVVEFYGDDIVAHPVGTGAFKLKSWRRGSRIVLERNPQYRGDIYSGTPGEEPLAQQIAQGLKSKRLPLADEVVVDIVEESQPRWLSFLDGTYHWLELPGAYAPIAVPQGQLAPYLQKKGIRLQRSVQPDMAFSFFYMDHPLVGGYTPDKVALRRAIGLAFDGEGYIRHVMGGQGVHAQSPVPPFTSGFDPAYKSEMSDHDPARAKALLDLYGYVDRDGDGWREQPDGKPLVLQMSSLATQRDRLSNEIWQRSLQRVGLKIEFDISTWPELLKKSRAGTLMMWGYAWSAQSPDGGFFLSIAYGPNASESNDARFKLPAFDRVFEAQRALPDGPQRDKLIREGKDLLMAYMPFKVHLHRIMNDLVQPWTRGYWRHPFMRDIWRFVDIDPGASA